jgi:hypothetical protein
MPPPYGIAITKASADILFQGCTAIKSRVQSNLTAALGRDREAIRYLNGTDIAYVFQKDALQTLVNRLQSSDDCIVLFSGCKFDDDENTPGRPTLIAFAFNVTTDPQGHLIATINLGSSYEPDGFQHPGNFKTNVHVPSNVPEQLDISNARII